MFQAQIDYNMNRKTVSNQYSQWTSSKTKSFDEYVVNVDLRNGTTIQQPLSRLM